MTYQESQRLIYEAEAAIRTGDSNIAKHFFMQAAIIQKDLLKSVPQDRVKTRSVFGLSAASLLYKAGDLDASERFAHELLSQTWVESYSASKLKELLLEIWNARARTKAVAVDTLDVRILPTNKTSTIRLRSAPDVYNAIYRLFAYSASLEERLKEIAQDTIDSVRDRLASHFDTMRWIGAQFAAELSITPSEARSFSFRVESIVDDTNLAGILGSEERARAFKRRVMVRVVRGLARCRRATDEGQWNNAFFEYTKGMNANMSQALIDLYGEAGGTIEFSASWSADYPEVDDDVRSIGVIKCDDDVVDMASRIYKAQIAVPNSGEPKTVRGFIVGLKDKDPDETEVIDGPGYNDKKADLTSESEEAKFNKDRVVTIHRTSVSLGKRVHFSLSEADYKTACDAHRDRKEVWAKGSYKRKFGKWILDPCEAFGVDVSSVPPPPSEPPPPSSVAPEDPESSDDYVPHNPGFHDPGYTREPEED
jgi:hypothetical protein